MEKFDQFKEKDITKYLTCYIKEMELKHISEKEIVQLFELVSIPEIRNHVKSIIGHFGGSWEKFFQPLKDEFFLEDNDQVTKKSFLSRLKDLRKIFKQQNYYEFERQYSY